MDTTQALKDAENSLRDFIADILEKKFGAAWTEQTGVSADRVKKWKERKEIEAKRQMTGTVEERLLYYADFYDIKTILDKRWELFAPALGEKKTMAVWLEELEKLRDPDAHRRELLPHQKHLALGISGEIRGRIVRYRSKQETADDCFPRIESARDNFGNIWTQGQKLHTAITETHLRPGDQLDFIITAADPLGEKLLYRMDIKGNSGPWQESEVFSLTVTEQHIGRYFKIDLHVKSQRQYHAHNSYDAWVEFMYTVLPPRI